MPQLTQYLTRFGRLLAIRDLLRLAGWHVAGVTAALLALEAAGAVAPVREHVAGAAILAAGAASCLSFIVLAWLLNRRHSRTAQIARVIEARHPELRDALNCAAEIEARGGAPNAIEALLLDTVRKTVDANRAVYLRPLLVQLRRAGILLLTAAALFLTISPGLKSVRKFHNWLHDGDRPGITLVEPADNAQVPVHGDVAVVAIINRGAADAVIHYEFADSPLESYPMQAKASSPRQVGFTFFDLARPVRFRITTDDLASPWFHLGVYDPPAVKSARITVVHQSYTHLPTQTFAEFQDIAAVQGDAIVFEANVENCLGVQLRSAGAIRHFQHLSPTGFRLDAIAGQSGGHDILAVNIQGEAVPVAQFAVAIQQDQPPVIERAEPGEDVKLKPTEAMRLAATASDDFGIAAFQFQYRIVGKHDGALDFTPHDIRKEVSCDTLWDLSRLNLQPGDMISCMLVAVDNHPPVPHTARTEPFYVTIVPDLSAIEAGGESPGQEEQIDLSDLVAESKRIIRLTWDIRNLESPPARDVDEAVTALGDLHVEVGRRQVSMQKKLGQPGLPPPFGRLFAQCQEHLERAAEPIRAARYADSIAQQEDALAQLLRMEVELMKNKAKSDKAKGQKGEKGQDDKPQQKQEQPQDQKSQKDIIPEAIQKLRDIIVRQDALNAHLKLRDMPPVEAVQPQQTIRNDTDDVMQSLNNLEDARPPRAKLQDARGEMGGVIASCRKGDLQPAAIHGARAQKSLVESLAMLEALQRKAENEAIRKLADKAGELADSQQAEAQSSQALQQDKSAGTLQPNANKDARTRQENLRKQTQDIQKTLADAAEALEHQAPETARQLREAAAAIDRNGINGKQKKAANALLYKRFELAAQQQQDAARNLQELSRKIREAAEAMPAFTLEHLKQQLEQLQELARQTQNGQKQPTDSRRQLQEKAQRLGDMLKDGRLQELAQQAGKDGDAHAPAQERLQTLLQQIRRAMDITAEHILKMDSTRKLLLSREAVAPPDKYRRLVQEYFKDLGK